MTFGIQVKNNNGQLLIDSDLSHYHFIGKYTPYSTTQTPDLLDGPGTVSFGPNQNKDMTGMPSKGTIYKYTIPSNGVKPPMVFIKNTTNKYMSVIVTNKVGGNWDTWVFSSGTGTAPTVYAFGPRNQFASSPSGFGLETYNASGDSTFDSNLKPLRVIGGGNITAPATAHTGSFGGVYVADLDVNVSDSSSTFSSSANENDIIYYCPSIAHACHQYEYQQSDSGISAWQQYAWSRGDLWWCFYRSGFKITSGSGNTKYFKSNYGVYTRGHVWQHVADSSNIFVGLILGAITGGAYFALALAAIVATGAFTNSGVAAGGYLPYVNGSRNSSLPNTYILTRASYYD
jgi:hypothetical protein